MTSFTPAVLRDQAAKSSRLVWVWPRVALLLLGVALLSLLLYMRGAEQAVERSVLISDVLWAEQTLHFQFDQTEDKARAIASAAALGAMDQGGFRDRSALLLNGDSGVIGLATLDLGGQLRFQAGAQLPPRAQWQGAVDYAAATGRPAYARPQVIAGEAVVMLALAEGDARAVVMISLNRLLNRQIPWWFAAKYRLSLLDLDGRAIASKSNVEAGQETLSYQLPLDPPGHGISMRIAAYSKAGSPAQRVLLTLVAVLAAVVLFSWWRLRRHVQGRLQAEAALRSEHAFRKAMEDSLTIGMRARDMAGRIVYVNPAFCKMVGFDEAELLNTTPPYPYWDREDLARHQRQHDAVVAGLAPLDGYETRFRRKDGQLVDVVVYTAPLIDASGQQRGWMSSVIDVTERRRIEALTRAQEEKLQLTTRLTAIGEMASTLAHELNQPLMALSSYASAAKQLAQAPEQRSLLDPTLDKIAEQAQRAAQVIRRVREFVRKRTPEFETCAINSVVEDAVALIEADANNRGVRIGVSMSADGVSLRLDRILIEQVLINLIRNAIEACEGLPAEHRQVQIEVESSDVMVGVRVLDRGCGIDAEQALHLFEAFHTTKPMGMGIGLSICRSIIEHHRGKLGYVPNPQGGAIFHFSLPR
jgi:two-component system sensor histidine kinase DctS